MTNAFLLTTTPSSDELLRAVQALAVLALISRGLHLQLGQVFRTPAWPICQFSVAVP
jgi:hypothetical protein